MNFRNTAFWIKDRLAGGRIRQHLNDVTRLMNMGIENPERIAITRNKIDELLTYCIKNVPYYKQLNPALQLASFPVVDKNILRERKSEFLSDIVNERNRLRSITSGSTGTPFEIFHDRSKKDRNSADTLYFAKLVGYQLGEKLGYLKIWSGLNRKSRLTQWLQNIIPIDVLNLESESKAVLNSLSLQNRPLHLIGYASAFETLCKAFEGAEISNFREVSSIITISESLNDSTRNSIEKYFRCRPFARYSNIENGIIAQQTFGSGGGFVVNTASFIVEILDIKLNTPVSDGSIGRIVVTDLFNIAMPLVRYDTGDLGSIDYTEVDGVVAQVLTRIEGRKMDQVFNTRGEMISSFVVYKNMWKYPEIDQYQFQQMSQYQYCIQLCVSKNFEKSDELITEFKQYLGIDANITIEYVREIPLLASGKRKKVVNLMNS